MTWRRRDERGAVLPITVLTMVIMIGFTALAADIGLQRVAIRDMQAVADVAALDAARKLPTCTTTTLQNAANASLVRQRTRVGTASPLVVTPGHLSSTGDFVTGAGTSGCDAVRVTSSTTVAFAFAPAIGQDSGTASRAAVGTKADASVCFSAGTRALVLNSSESALGPLLDKILRVNLGVVGYSGLVDLKGTFVPLVDVTAELGITQASQLATTNVRLRDFLVATATVLRRQGSTAQAQLLENIGVQVSSLTVNLGRFLTVGSSGNSALTAKVSALDLIGTAVVTAAIANGQSAVALGADLGLPLDLVNARARLTLIEPPVIACGGVGSKAKTAQVRLDIQTGVNVLGLLSAANVSMGIRVASGTAELTSLTCGTSGTQSSTTVRGTTSLADLTGYGGTGNATLSPISLLGISLSTVRLAGSVGQKTTTQQFPYPPAPALTQIFGGGERIIFSSPDSTTNSVLSVINNLTGTVDLLIRPLLKLLGMELGIMEVRMLGTPTCGTVRLAG